MEMILGFGAGMLTATAGEFTGVVVGNPMSAFQSALEPLGLITAIAVIPGLLQKTLIQGYQASMQGMPPAMQMAAIGGTVAALHAQATSRDNVEASDSSKEEDATTLDEAAAKSEQRDASRRAAKNSKTKLN